jgi:excisionase family DNA binding protein
MATVAFVSFVTTIRSVSKALPYAVTGTDRERLATAFPRSGASSEPVKVETGDRVIELPAAAADAVRHLLAELASGASVHVLARDAELTTQEAADLLGLSRTYLVRLIDQGKLPARLVGTHRRVRVADVLAYQARRSARLQAVAEITRSDRAADIPYQ